MFIVLPLSSYIQFEIVYHMTHKSFERTQARFR